MRDCLDSGVEVPGALLLLSYGIQGDCWTLWFSRFAMPGKMCAAVRGVVPSPYVARIPVPFVLTQPVTRSLSASWRIRPTSSQLKVREPFVDVTMFLEGSSRLAIASGLKSCVWPNLGNESRKRGSQRCCWLCPRIWKGMRRRVLSPRFSRPGLPLSTLSQSHDWRLVYLRIQEWLIPIPSH